ncbi:hypothetical protein EB796_015503 [Bugula neritina]|uniref:Uncharacterized protein n=1 Tax=Bugula neritina TaxID=10212 RepID=A0A7J7JJG6_BUGNE|nr:hypothetical protein EB796_015503 [Bugula neritina]
MGKSLHDLPAYKLTEHLYSKVPTFDSVFDEETFYIVFFLLVIFSFLGAYVASRYVTLDDASVGKRKKQ